MISAGVVVTDPEFRNRIVEILKGLGVRIAFAVEETSGQAGRMESTNPDLLVLDFSRPGIPAVMAEAQVVGSHGGGYRGPPDG